MCFDREDGWDATLQNLIPGGRGSASAIWSPPWKLNGAVLLRQRGATTLLVLNSYCDVGILWVVSEAGFSSFEKDGGKMSRE